MEEEGSLSFREKRRRFVEPVLLRDDGTDLVRQAFRKRIFLRYRQTLEYYMKSLGIE